MPTQDQFQAAMVGALAAQPRDVSYPDYKTSADFPRWLSGYEARIRDAFGFQLDENDKVITDSGRSAVGADPQGENFPWHPQPMEELNEVGKARPEGQMYFSTRPNGE